MKLAPIVLKLRLANTTFGNYIAGSAELATALEGSLRLPMAFVIPLADSATPNTMENSLQQHISERFGIVVAIKNDATNSDKLGTTAYDTLDDIRAEIFKGILGWDLDDDVESVISYVGGKLLGIDRAYLWYQFEFEYAHLIIAGVHCLEDNTDGDGVAFDRSTFADLKTIYANYVFAPSANLPHTGDLPLDDNFPDVVLPDQAQWIDLTKNPDDGSFGTFFGTGFNLDKN